MIDQQKTIRQSRLGLILIKKNYINQAQLLKALGYQTRRKIKLGTALIELKLISRKQLNLTLRRQNWIRTIATCIALACSPFCTAFGTEHTSKLDIKSETSQDSEVKNYDGNNEFNPDIQFYAPRLSQRSKEFYFTDNNQLGYSFSQSSGIQLSLYASQSSSYRNQGSYGFKPQISLFKSSSSGASPTYRNKRISNRINRYSRPQPVIYMLTLKGRCLAESAGNETIMWSLDSAKYGVQRKAELMFSITKLF